MGLFHKEMDVNVDRKHVEEFYASDAAMKRRKNKTDEKSTSCEVPFTQKTISC